MLMCNDPGNQKKKSYVKRSDSDQSLNFYDVRILESKYLFFNLERGRLYPHANVFSVHVSALRSSTPKP